MASKNYKGETINFYCFPSSYIFVLDPGSGMEKIRILDKHPGSATLETKKI
jgi:hypothetical protein